MKDARYRKIIEHLTDYLVREYDIKSKDRNRVHAIMKRTAIKGRIEVEFIPDLEEALGYLAPEDALKAFESIDLKILSQRNTFVKYLTAPFTPFYTLEELVIIAEKFKTHLQNNYTSLLKTGFPKTSFEKSKWFDSRLSLLYYVKFPLCCRPINLPSFFTVGKEDELKKQDMEGNLIYTYLWADKYLPFCCIIEGTKDKPICSSLFEADVPFSFCEYEKAALIDGLSFDIIARLEKGREKFLRVKMDIMDAIKNCTQSPFSHKSVLAKSLKILTNAFTKQEIIFYFEVESIFKKLNINSSIRMLFDWDYPSDLLGTLSGGIIELFLIIGHFEEELIIGTFDKTKSIIQEKLHEFDDLESYYQIIGNPNQLYIDTALDDFRVLNKQQEKFWKDFRENLKRKLETEFEIELTIKTKIKTKYIEEFEDFIQKFADWQASHFKMTGKFATLGNDLKMDKIKTNLSDNQKKDYVKCEYKCYDNVHIPGNIPINKSNLIFVNKKALKIGDSIFKLFLRLILEVKRKEKGWVNIYDLEIEGIIKDPMKYQPYSNLRTALVGCLLDNDGQRFIENDGSKRYRISTHPDLITYNKEKLITHTDIPIREIAERLP